MSVGLYANAALDTLRPYIGDSFGNPLRAADLPHTERQWLGCDVGEVVKDGNNPGVDTLQIHVIHPVGEWQENTAYAPGAEVRSTGHNGFVYEAGGGGGTSGPTPGDEPAWPTTIGATVLDNGITWECVRRTTEPEAIKLAATSGGLAAATAGASLDLGITELAGGPANAVEVWVEVDGIAASTRVEELYIGNDNLVLEAA